MKYVAGCTVPFFSRNYLIRLGKKRNNSSIYPNAHTRKFGANPNTFDSTEVDKLSILPFLTTADINQQATFT
jgi:hypothetical protein